MQRLGPGGTLFLKSKSPSVLYLLAGLDCFSNRTSFIRTFCPFNMFIKKKLEMTEKCAF